MAGGQSTSIHANHSIRLPINFIKIYEMLPVINLMQLLRRLSYYLITVRVVYDYSFMIMHFSFIPMIPTGIIF